jgi:hypothetical protein
MAKAKLKRERRELEKLQRSGRYLEWLVAVGEMPVTVELRRDLDKAWAEVRRRALRTRESFEEYCRLRSELGKIPQNPENVFLEALADLMRDVNGSAETLLAVPKLSGAYLAAQQHLDKILRQERDWSEVERLLSLMAREPGKISRKQVQSLATCLTGSGFEQAFEALGQDLMTFRKLNHKTHLNKQLSRGFLASLAEADNRIWNQLSDFSSPLRRLLLLPLAEQVRLHLRQAMPPPGPQQVRALFDSVRHVFLEVAGPHLSEELRERLNARFNDDCSDAACRRLEQRISAATFEERLALLRDFRRVVHREAMREDEDLATAFSNLDVGVTEAMERVLIHCHHEVIREIGRRLPELSARDRRALILFYDNILTEDLSLLLFPDADLVAQAQLVRQTLEAGCGGTRLAMLAPFVAAADRNRQLGRIAEQTLQTCAAPTDEDLRWFIDEHLQMALRFPTHLRKLFTRMGENAAQTERLAKAMWKEYSANMLMAGFVDEVGSFLPHGMGDGECLLFTPEVLKELVELTAQVPQLAQFHRFLEAFPSGRVDSTNLRQWFEMAWSADEQCGEFLRVALPLLHEANERADMIRAFQSSKMPREILTTLSRSVQQLAAVVDFLRSRSEDFRGLPLSVLTILVEQVFPCLEREQEFSSLLIRTYNVLCARVKAGEDACASLRDELERRMRTMAKHRR